MGGYKKVKKSKQREGDKPLPGSNNREILFWIRLGFWSIFSCVSKWLLFSLSILTILSSMFQL